MERRVMGNYHARCGAGEKPEVTTPEAYLSLFALPDDYCSLLSTMRSREISSIIIIQNLAQIKALFKDTWETIPGNCDTLIYLGGNEQSTHKYVSELLGKGTIDKRATGETLGRQGSSSRNYDVLGRELLTPDEARKFDNKKCLIFIRGFDPIMDNKYVPFGHPAFNQTADGDGEPYIHTPNQKNNLIGKPFELLSPKAVSFFETLKAKGENVYIDSLTYEQFMLLGELDMQRRFTEMDEAQQKEKLNNEQSSELEYVDESEAGNSSAGGTAQAQNVPLPKLKGEDSITNRMVTWKYSTEQKSELRKLLEAQMPKEEILKFFYPDTPVEQMTEIRETFEEYKRQKM